ncbi:retention module-containing protein [Aeromonas sp. 6P]|uniref:retention module-containing protein n=1 Tax=Aeromonas sp. 6P TaxID=3452722 RepID=UPI003F7A2E2E
MITNAVTLEQGVTVTQLKGQIYLVAEDGSRKLLAEGDVLPKGAVIMSPDGASFMGGGQSFTVQPASEQSEPAEEGDAPQLAQNGAAGTPDDISALQQAILGGADPTQAFEASAAGGAPAAGGGGIGGVAGASGNGGFVTIDRTGDATIAEAGFDTDNPADTAPIGDALGGEDDILFDGVPPSITVNAPDNTNDTTPTITGTTDAPAGSTVTLVVTDANGNQQTLTAIVQPGGSYSVDVTTPLAEGSYKVDASVTDPAGNTGTATDDGSVEIDDPVDAVNDSYEVNEDGSVSLSLLANDKAPDGGLKVVAINGVALTGGAQSIAVKDGVVEIAADGSMTFKPSKDFNGNISFDYEVEDTDGDTDSAIVNITVNNVDDLVDAVDDEYTVNEDGSVSLSLLANDKAPDGGLKVVAINGVALTGGAQSIAVKDGVVEIAADGSMTFKPSKDFNGNISFDYEVEDTDGDTDSAIVNITVNNVDDLVDAVDDEYTVNEDGSVSLSLLANDKAPDGGLKVVAINGVALTGGAQSIAVKDGVVEIAADGSMTFKPSKDFNGNISFDYEVEDTDGDTDSAIVNITVNNVDDLVDAVDDEYTVNEDGSVSLSLLANDKAPDGGLKVVAINGVALTGGAQSIAVKDGVVEIAADGSMTFKPSKDFNGNISFDYEVEDTDGDTDSAIVNITVNNVDDLVDAVDDEYTVNEDGSVSLSLLANDKAPDGGLKVVAINGVALTGGAQSIAVKDGVVEIAADGSMTFKPSKDFNGNISFDYEVEDTDGDTDSAIVNITVNNVDDLVDAVDDEYTVNEDGSVSLSLLANDKAPDGGLKVVAINGVALTGGAQSIAVKDGVVEIAADGSMTFKPSKDFNGNISFDYEVEDTDGDTDSAIVNITVNNVDDLVDAVDDEYTVNEDGSVSLSLLANDKAPDGGLKVVAINGVALTGGAQSIAVKDGVVEIAADGSMTFKPSKDFNGNISFDYEVEDTDGDTDSAIVNITVNNVDDLVDAVDDEYTVNEDGSVSLSLLANDKAPDGGLKVVAINGVALTGGAQSIAVKDGVVEIAADGSMTFKPSKDFNGNISFDYEVEDTDGDTDSAIVNITVNNVDDLVDAVDDEYTVNEDGSVSLSLLANDKAPDGGLKVVAINGVALTGGAQSIAVKDGVVEIAADGSMTFKPSKDFNGNISFDYEVEDTDGDTDSAIVNITVNNVDDLVDAVDDEYTVNEDGSVSLSLLANDKAPDGGLKVVAINGVALTGGAQSIAVKDGVVEIAADGSMTFKPSKDFNGNISFDYEVEDTDGDTDSAIVNITVNNVDDLVDAVDDEYTVNEDGSVSLSLLANDKAPDGGLKVVAINGVALTGGAQSIAVKDGVVEIAADGSMTFKPSKDFNGNISFDYEVEDTDGDTDSAIVNITVNNVDDLVDAVDDEYTVNEDGSVSLSLLANDKAPDGGLKVVAINGVALTGGAQSIAVKDGVVEIAADGSMTFKPSKDFNGNISFDYEVEDTDGDTDSAIVNITVNNVDDLVDAVDDEYTVNEDGSVSLSLLANDKAPDGGLKVVAINGVALTGGAQSIAVKDGVVEIAADGSMTFKPSKDFNGNISFDYEVEDTDGDTDSAIVNITVNNVDDLVDAVDDEYTVNEDGSVSLSLLANDKAPDGGLKVVAINGVALTGGAQSIAVKDGVVEIAADGSMTFKPSKDFNGNISFDYEVEDTDGDTDSAIVNITVNNVDDLVDAVDDEYTVNEDGSVSLSLLANDKAPDGGLKVVAINGVALTGGAQSIAVKDGVVEIAADGSMTFKPSKDFNGNISFDYEVEDTDGDTDSAIVNITVNNVDDLVDAVDDEYTVNEDGSVSLSLLANDKAPDGGLKVVAINGVALTGGAQSIAVKDGVVEIAADGSMTFKPSKDFNGNISFDYEVEDTDGDTDSAIVNITVNNVDDLVDAVDDEYTVNEDGSVSLSLLANDKAPDGGLKVVAINGVALTGGAQSIAVKDGVVEIAADGSMTFKPSKDFNGNISFDYEVEDTDGDTDSAIVNITVNNVDDLVDAVDDEYTVNEDGSVSLSLLANDKAPDGGLKVVAINGVALTGGAQSIAVKDGVVEIAADGSMTFKPSKDFNGNISFDYEVEDTDGDTDSAIVNITVNNVDDLVDAVDDEYTVNEDGSVSLSLLANDKAPDGGLKVVAINGVALTGGAQSIAVKDGVVEIAADGSMTFKPSKDFNGNISFDYEVEDTDGDTDSAIVNITVNNVDDLVDAVDDEYTVNEDGSVSLSLLANDKAPDGGLKVVAINGVALTGGAQSIAVKDGVVEIAADGSMTFKPSKDFNGNISFDYEVEDTDGDTDSAIVNITVNNVDDLVDAVDDEYTVNEDGSVSLSLLANDKAPDGGLKVVAINGVALTGGAQSIAVKDGVVEIAADGSMTFKPSKDFNGNISFDYEVEDTDGDTDSAIVNITVNNVDDLVDAVDDEYTVNEDGSVSLSLLANDKAPDGGLKVVAINGVALTGGAQSIAVKDGVVEIAADGSMTFKPSKDFNGNISFDYEVEDTDGDTDSAIVNITVNNVDDLVDAVDDEYTVNEDGSVSLSLLANDKAPDGGLKVVAINGVALTGGAQSIAVKDGVVEIAADGSMTFKPSKDFNGNISFDYEVEDTDGDTDSAIVNITVNNVDDLVDAVDDEYTVNEDGSVSLSLLANDKAPDGGLKVVAINGVALTGGAQSIAVKDGVVEIAADGSMTFKPSKDFNGNISFDYEVEDTDGDTDSAIVNITVNNVDDLVDAVDDEYTVNEDGSVSLSLLANDKAPDGGLKVVAINGVALTGGAQSIAVKDGVVEIAADGSMTFKPSKDFNGNISFDYEVEDTDGDTDSAIVNITVNNVDDLVDAVDDEYTVNEDGSVSLSLLANDKAPDGGLKVVAINGVALTGGAQSIAVKDGVVEIAADGSMTFKPSKDFNGNISFDYEVEDTDGDTDSAIVNITVTPVNDAPTTSGGYAQGEEDMPLTLKWSDFKASDVDTAADKLSIKITSLPADGVLQYKDDDGNWLAVVENQVFTQAEIAAGKLQFKPDPHEASGSADSGAGSGGVGNKLGDYASFGYQVSDGVNSSGNATFVVDIKPVVDGVTLKVELVSGGFVPGAAKVEQILSDLNGKTPSRSPTTEDDYLVTNGSRVNGGGGNDTIKYGTGFHFEADGGTGNDILIGGGSVTDNLDGGDGDDILIGGKNATASVTLNAGAGDDMLIAQSLKASTTYYGWDGKDVAYVPGSMKDFQLVMGGSPNQFDYRLIYTGTNAGSNRPFHDFYSVETLYLQDGKYEFKNGNLTKVADLATLKVDVDLKDIDGSERFTDLTITGLPTGAVVQGGSLQADGSWKVPASMLDQDGKVSLQVELPTGSENLKVTVKAGSQEYEMDGLPIAGEVKYTEADTGFMVKPTNPNGDNGTSDKPVEGGRGDDVLLGDIGGIKTSVEPGKNYNIALIVDTSGSMKFGLDGRENPPAGQDRMTLTINALKALANQLAGHDGVVNVTLIGFSTSASSLLTINDLSKSGKEKLQDFIDKLSSLKADGATNYEDAFIKAAAWFNSQPGSGSGKTFENLTYFLTDGNPTVYNGDTSGSGGTTDDIDMQKAIDAFANLSGQSEVKAIGIGNGVTQGNLAYFDNTKVVGSGSKYENAQLLNDFSGNTGPWSASSWSKTGDSSGSVDISGGRLTLTDKGDNGVSVFRSEKLTVAAGTGLRFDLSTGNDFGRGDTFSVQLQRWNGSAWENVGAAVTSAGTVNSGALAAGDYRYVFTVNEDDRGDSATLLIDNLNKVMGGRPPVGQPDIITTADQLKAVLVGSSTTNTPAEVGVDVLHGGAGNDILFGDAINTDHLPWGTAGNPTKPADWVNGKGLDGLTQFLTLKNGYAPSSLELYEYIKGNANSLDVAGDTRGGNDKLHGGLGDDILFGQGGNDSSMVMMATISFMAALAVTNCMVVWVTTF